MKTDGTIKTAEDIRYALRNRGGVKVGGTVFTVRSNLLEIIGENGYGFSHLYNDHEGALNVAFVKVVSALISASEVEIGPVVPEFAVRRVC